MRTGEYLVAVRVHLSMDTVALGGSQYFASVFGHSKCSKQWKTFFLLIHIFRWLCESYLRLPRLVAMNTLLGGDFVCRSL